MDDKHYKTALAKALRDKGVSIAEVPESNDPSPDFEAEFGGDNFLIELKTRFDVELEDQGEVRTDGLARTNPTSRIIKDAVRQLASHRSDDTVSLIWILAPPHERSLVYEQFRGTAYGVRIAVGPDCLKDCYYATFNDFYRFKEDLDGIALGVFGGLLLNEFSPRFTRLRSSDLRRLFGEAVWDPQELEAAGDILTVRSDLDRRNEAEVKGYLNAKYDLDVLSLTNLVRFSA